LPSFNLPKPILDSVRKFTSLQNPPNETARQLSNLLLRGVDTTARRGCKKSQTLPLP
jgi:hypothetical protein